VPRNPLIKNDRKTLFKIPIDQMKEAIIILSVDEYLMKERNTKSKTKMVAVAMKA
jgi:hypothetical protein